MRLLPTLLIAAAAVLAASAPAHAAPLQLSGPTLDGGKFDLQALRGRVVMLFFWNTDCVPCVLRMPELRANAMGWRAKPFTLVLVSTDRDRQAALGYVKTLRQVDKAAVDTPFLWAGEQRLGGGLTVPSSVPVTLVLDAKGEVVARHVGRIAPEAWDDVAGLLP